MTSSPFDAWITNDDEVTSLLAQEWQRQTTTIQLIASENFASPAVLAATGSILTNKYAEGYPGRRYYGGNQVVDEVEDLARRRLTALFGADHANVQPHSGANANVAVYQALLEPGDTILAHATRPGWPPHARLARLDHVEVVELRLLRRDAALGRSRASPAR